MCSEKTGKRAKAIRERRNRVGGGEFMYAGVKTTGCTDLFLFVRSCIRIRLAGFIKSVRKPPPQNEQNFGCAKQKFFGARQSASILFSSPAKPRDINVVQRGLGRVKLAVHLYLLVPLYHLPELTLCARRQDLDWKECGSVLSAHTAELVAAWQHAPGRMPPAVSHPPCARRCLALPSAP